MHLRLFISETDEDVLAGRFLTLFEHQIYLKANYQSWLTGYMDYCMKSLQGDCS